ncbi:ExbD/TolR family protein [Candidatus Acidulodesulfobacterium sp. H_13]|uniref:ExbD/TolR family protein n=1 Tax=Candidatus Acidulodesulfobacterium sp. H_13 TaxID=3395470 RepID=UPI003AF694F0
MKLTQGQEIKKARIELVPMIDIMFFLLVFFIFVTLSMVHQKGLNVHLPKSSQGSAIKMHNFVVTLKKNGSIFLNKEKTNFKGLPALLKQRVVNKKDLIVINGDEGIYLKRVVKTINIIKKDGFLRVSIAVNPTT